MGCDIHCYKERLVDGAWVNQQPMSTYAGEEDRVESADISRDYRLFGLLAKGVRNAYTLSFEPRGLPADMSSEIAAEAESWSGDAHNMSWLTLEEIKTKQLILLVSPESENADLGSSLADFADTMFDPSDEPASTRVVFWFDN